MADVTTLTRTAFCRRLAMESVQPVSLVTVTEPAMRRRGNPLLERGVRRRAQRLGMIGACYESSVNRQRDREGRPMAADGTVEHFIADRLWQGQGRHVPGNRHLVYHATAGTLYLVFFPRTSLSGQVIGQREHYETADGEPLDASAVKPWLRTCSPSRRQQTQKPILWRTVKLESIESITMGRRTFFLTGCAPLATDLPLHLYGRSA